MPPRPKGQTHCLSAAIKKGDSDRFSNQGKADATTETSRPTVTNGWGVRYLEFRFRSGATRVYCSLTLRGQDHRIRFKRPLRTAMEVENTTGSITDSTLDQFMNARRRFYSAMGLWAHTKSPETGVNFIKNLSSFSVLEKKVPCWSRAIAL